MRRSVARSPAQTAARSLARPRSVPFAALVTLAAQLAACSGEEPAESAPNATARFVLPADGSLPPYLDVPFPSDLYLEADGTIARELPGLELYVPVSADRFRDALDPLRGFGRIGGASFRLEPAPGGEGVVEAGSLPATEDESLAPGSSVVLLDLDAGSAATARLPARVRVQDDRVRGGTSPPTLAVLPARGTLLPEGHRVAAVLTTDVRLDAEASLGDGSPLAPSADLQAIVEGKRDSEASMLVGEALDRALELAPELDGRVAAIASYTTLKSSHELVAMREAIAGAAAPVVSWDPADVAPMHAARFGDAPGFDATLGAWLGVPDVLASGEQDPARDQPHGAAHDALAAVATGVFEAPNFLLERGGYDDPTHRTLARDASGAPIVNPEAPTSKVWVTVALPKGPVPPGGFPVVVIQHGLQDDRSFLVPLANTFAREGWASVAIEGVTFGARAKGATFTTDAASTFAWSNEAGAYTGPDGFVDQKATAISFFGEFTGFGALRDQLRQSVLDVTSLLDALTAPTLDLGPLVEAVPGAALDPTRVAFVGDSFGSIMGSMVASIEPRASAYVLNVGGGGIVTEIAAWSPRLSGVLSGGAALTYGISNEWLSEAHPVTQLLQTIVEPGDPLVHAHRVLSPALGPPRNTLLLEVLWDEILTNQGSEALARRLGLPLAEPHVGPNAGVPLNVASPDASGSIHDVPFAGVTAALVQVAPASHGNDFYSRAGSRNFAPPFGQDGYEPFPPAGPFELEQPYVALQRMSVLFLADAFAGVTPRLRDIPVPVRDFDLDGVLDADDAEPLDPTAW